MAKHRSEDRDAEISHGPSRNAAQQASHGLPEYGGRQELAGDELSSTHPAIDRAAQPVLHGVYRSRSGFQLGGRRNGRGSQVSAYAGHKRKYRQARGLRRDYDGGSLEVRAARSVSDGG